MNEINLKEIWNKWFEECYSKGVIKPEQAVLGAMKEVCEKAIDLSAENAQLTWEVIDYNEKTYWVDKESILNTKNQIK